MPKAVGRHGRFPLIAGMVADARLWSEGRRRQRGLCRGQSQKNRQQNCQYDQARRSVRSSSSGFEAAGWEKHGPYSWESLPPDFIVIPHERQLSKGDKSCDFTSV
jgi:hypothetical protein